MPSEHHLYFRAHVHTLSTLLRDVKLFFEREQDHSCHSDIRIQHCFAEEASMDGDIIF